VAVAAWGLLPRGSDAVGLAGPVHFAARRGCQPSISPTVVVVAGWGAHLGLEAQHLSAM